MEAALLELQYQPITTDLVRSIDRMSHNLLLKFTIGLDSKVIDVSSQDDYVDHDDNDDVVLKQTVAQYDDDKIIDMDDTDGLTDVLNDFEEIRNSLNDDVDINFNDNDFNGIHEDNDSRHRSFNDHVEGLFNGKEMNNLDDLMGKNGFSAKSINNDIEDIINDRFNKTDIKKSLDDNENLTAVKKALNDEISQISDTAILNKSLNDNLPDDITFTDVSINTNDLNENDNSNLMDAINNFILDHDYLDEKFLIETGEADSSKKLIIPKKTDEESLLREIIPEMSKKEKKQITEESADNAEIKKAIQPVKQERVPLKNIKKHIKKVVKSEPKIEDESDSPFTKTEMPLDIPDTNELGSDFVKFGEDFNFRIFVLTRQEQLEELEKKREGVLYLRAPYKCVKCAKGFRSPDTYKNHLKVHDPSRGAFECPVCRARFASAPRRRRHADAHRLKYCCTRCEFVARTRDKAESHYEWHAGRTYSCEHCGETFGKVSTQLSHVRLRHPAACAACAACGEGFVGALGLRLHYKRVHSAEPQPQAGPRASRRGPARPRAAGCPSPGPCEECGDRFPSDESLRRHLLSHSHAPVQCQICEASFESATSLQTHFERVHLLVRGRKQDSAIRVKSAARGNVEKKKAMCEICGNKYHSAAALSYHQRSHSGERPFGCPRCSKTFAFSHSLQAHVRTHTGERPHACAQCARAFRTANNLQRHRRAVHLGQKPYARCSVCRKWLSSPGAVRLHVATVHHNMPWPRKKTQRETLVIPC